MGILLIVVHLSLVYDNILYLNYSVPISNTKQVCICIAELNVILNFLLWQSRLFPCRSLTGHHGL